MHQRMDWKQTSDQNQQPAPPKEGLPPQRTPRWLAKLLQRAVYPFMWLDLTIQRLIFWLQPPPYELKGHCKKRGNCCHYILMAWHPLLDKWPWLGKFWLWWYTDIHGFYLRGFEIEGEGNEVAKVMSCRHLQQDGTCGNYPLRPAICHQWPRREYVTQPHLLKGCGYFAIPRDLDAPPSPPEATPTEATPTEATPTEPQDTPKK